MKDLLFILTMLLFYYLLLDKFLLHGSAARWCARLLRSAARRLSPEEDPQGESTPQSSDPAEADLIERKNAFVGQRVTEDDTEHKTPKDDTTFTVQTQDDNAILDDWKAPPEGAPQPPRWDDPDFAQNEPDAFEVWENNNRMEEIREELEDAIERIRLSGLMSEPVDDSEPEHDGTTFREPIV